jgi:1,4-alpha-glucan branching enzyme
MSRTGRLPLGIQGILGLVGTPLLTPPIAMPRGYLALVIELHHPLPGPGQEVGRDWAQAAVSTYWPLLRALVAAANSGLSEVATLAVSPSWTALAADSAARALAVAELDERVAQAERQGSGGGWAEYWRGLRGFAVEQWGSGPLGALRRAQQSGAVEVICTTSSHAWLPGVADLRVIARAQMALAAADHTRLLSTPPQGIWLPHLAYRPGLEQAIASARLRYFTVDADALCRGTARPPAGPYGVLVTPPGASAIGIDRAFTEPHRHYGRDPRYADPYTAQAAIADHVAHFLDAWQARLASAPSPGPHPPISLVGLAAHDLGGRWLLGGLWLDRLLKRVAESDRWQATTPGRYLDRYPDGPLGLPGPSAGGLLSVRPAGSDLIDRCRTAAEALAEAIERRERLSPVARRAVAQMTRMLLRAQGLDWHLPPDFPCGHEEGLARAERCLAQFTELAGLLAAGRLDPTRLTFQEAALPAYLPEINLDHLAEG